MSLTANYRNKDSYKFVEQSSRDIDIVQTKDTQMLKDVQRNVNSLFLEVTAMQDIFKAFNAYSNEADFDLTVYQCLAGF